MKAFKENPLFDLDNSLKCPLCNDKAPKKLVHSKLRYGDYGSIQQCDECDYVFLFPRLSEEEQKAYYTNEYRRSYEDPSVQERFITDFPEAIRRLNHVLQSNQQAQSLLEIGVGSGAFLSLARSYFGTTVGIELDKETHSFLKQKNFEIHEDLRSLKDRKFDVIVLFHVLEHFLDPIEFLNQLKQHLSPNGYIYIEVPNINDMLISQYNIEEFKDFYFCSAHLSYFSKKTLEYTLEKSGMKSVVSYIQRYDISNHLNWLLNKKPGGMPQNQNIFSKVTIDAYAEDLKAKGFTDTLWAVAKLN
jgi:2-polyprenyl-3-methyl-5-hydroxy-6-metoxy-1,4-benzoquinol methylase